MEENNQHSATEENNQSHDNVKGDTINEEENPNTKETIQEDAQQQAEVVVKNIDYKDQYLRLYAEFENYRKRTQKEKLDWIQTANKDIMIVLTDVLDDSLRAEEEIDKLDVDNNETLENALKGIKLVFHKLHNSVKQKGLTPIKVLDEDFDMTEHEAISEVEVEAAKKGKVIDEVQRGYKLNDKVIKFAKVVVGK